MAENSLPPCLIGEPAQGKLISCNPFMDKTGEPMFPESWS